MDVDVDHVRIITRQEGVAVLVGSEQVTLTRAAARVLGLALMEAADE